MVSPTSHVRLMLAMESFGAKLPSRMQIARTAGVSPATMNRDREFLDAYVSRQDSRLVAEVVDKSVALASEMARARSEVSRLRAAVQILAEVVQQVSLENSALKRELRRRLVGEDRDIKHI